MGSTASRRIDLRSNVAGANNGAPQRVDVGGSYCWAAHGTFGGTTIKLQMLGPDGVNYIDIPGASLTVAGVGIVELPANCTVRDVTTGGAATGMYSSLSAVD